MEKYLVYKKPGLCTEEEPKLCRQIIYLLFLRQQKFNIVVVLICPRHTRCLNVRLEEEMLLLEGLDL
jgi:hypothetical protein